MVSKCLEVHKAIRYTFNRIYIDPIPTLAEVNNGKVVPGFGEQAANAALASVLQGSEASAPLEVCFP